MNTIATAAAAAIVLSSTQAVQAGIVWGGPDVTFTKADFADPTDPLNQDRITDGVWITRGDLQGIYNAFSEAGYSNFSSPAGTAWAFEMNNPTADVSATNYANLTFEPWQVAVDSFPPDMLGSPGVLHLVDEDIYIDIQFTSWTCCGPGGGFSYTRSTVPGPSGLAILAVTGLVPLRRRRMR